MKKVAIVYDRVNKWGGAERVILTLNRLYPEADLITSVYDKNNASWANIFPNVKTTFLQNMPFIKKHHELVPYLMPLAFESLNLSQYDLIISISSEAAKGVITSPKQKHIAYILTPTRYLWSGYGDYFKNKLFKILTLPFVKYLRQWDKIAAYRPDIIIAISSDIKDRIKKYYNRDADVIFPPVKRLKEDKENVFKDKDYYLIVSRLVSYKKVDLAIKAFNILGLPLIIIGTGNCYYKLKKIAGDSIYFKGFLPDTKLASYYKHAKAFIMPQIEDFGITSIEAQMYGTPIIAFNKGGAKDTVIEGVTGTFFTEQSVESLVDAVQRFAKMKFNTDNIINNALRFSEDNFKNKFKKVIKND